MRVRLIVLVAGLVAVAVGLADADTLADVGRERRSYYIVSPPYSWYSTYDIEFASQELHVYTSIYLSGTGGVTQAEIDALEPFWKNGIEDRWNDKYMIRHDGEYDYDIIYDVSFVDTWQFGVDHYAVEVQPGPERSNMVLWDTEDTTGVAAHEYGHMIGNYDEYSGGATDLSDPIIDTTGIMGWTSPAAVTYARHYEPVVEWLEGKYPLALLEVVAVPEPATVVLMVLGGLALLGGAGRKWS